MQRVLVTGGAGFIGSHVCERLISRGDCVACVDNFDDFYPRAIKEQNVAQLRSNDRFSLRELDIRDRDRLLAAFRDFAPTVVVHLAARAGVRPSLENPRLYYDVNINGTQNVFDASVELKVSHVVAASSSSVYGSIKVTPFHEAMEIAEPLSPYAASKRMTELMAHVAHHTQGLNVTMLRFFTAYGPRQRPDMAIHKFTRLIESGQPVPMFGDGSTRRDYTYIDDIVDGVIRAVDRPLPYEIINLGEERTTALRTLIETIGAALGMPVRIDAQPLQTGDMAITFASVDKARALLGYKPSVTLEEGVRRFVEWHRAQHAPSTNLRQASP